MFIKYTDCGVRFHRPNNTSKDVSAYFFRALVIHEKNTKFVSAWDSTKEGARTKYEQKVRELQESEGRGQ